MPSIQWLTLQRWSAAEIGDAVRPVGDPLVTRCGPSVEYQRGRRVGLWSPRVPCPPPQVSFEFFVRLFASPLCWAVKRASGASLSAVVAFSLHCCSSVGYAPFSRHQVLGLSVVIAAVGITPCSRAAAFQTRSRAGAINASARHRSRLLPPSPILAKLAGSVRFPTAALERLRVSENLTVSCHFIASCP